MCTKSRSLVDIEASGYRLHCITGGEINHSQGRSNAIMHSQCIYLKKFSLLQLANGYEQKDPEFWCYFFVLCPLIETFNYFSLMILCLGKKKKKKKRKTIQFSILSQMLYFHGGADHETKATCIFSPDFLSNLAFLNCSIFKKATVRLVAG